MKKITGFAVALSIVFLSQLSLAGQMDLMLRGLVEKAKAPAAAQGSLSKALVKEGGALLIPCLIKSRDAHATAEAIEEAGGRAVLITDSIISAHLQPASVEAIVARKEVIAAEAARRLSAKMNSARTPTKVDVVQDGSALGTAYNGKNVVVGVVDDGLDYGHPDFLGSGGSSTRIQYVQQKSGANTLECFKSQINSDSCSIVNGGQGTYHGTHVTSMAAGSNGTYTGVAPEADIMFIFQESFDAESGGTFATSILEGVTKIFENATEMDKAAVANLSLGTSLGAHDGSSILEEGLTNLSSANVGRIIINAAGNEATIPAAFPPAWRNNVGGIHAPVSVAAGDSAGWRFAIWDGLYIAAVAYTGGAVVDIWLESGQKDTCSVQVLGYTGGRAAYDFTFPGATNAGSASFATSDLAFSSDGTDENAGGGVTASVAVVGAEANGKPHGQVLFSPTAGSTSAALESMWFDVVIRSTGAPGCSGHMWLYPDRSSTHDFTKDVATTAIGAGGGVTAYTLANNGNDEYTTTIPATAEGVIAVGSYMPPKPAGAATSTWTGDDGGTYDQSDLNAPGGTGSATDDLSSFSSLGPTAAPSERTKPDIVAPGEPIIAARAEDAPAEDAPPSVTIGSDHLKLEGTSMASPFVAGVVALLLERNNTLTVDEVRTALRTGATTAGMTAKTANTENSYGAGKIDAAAILGSVDVDTSAYSGTGDLEPSSGGSSCALFGSVAPGGGALSLFLVSSSVVSILVLRRRGKRKA